MSTFTLDTSGVVEGPISTPEGQRFHAIGWAFLTPFAQGYVEALFASAHAVLQAERERRWDNFLHSEVAVCPDGERFSDLAPEALGMILADCAAYCRGHHRQNCHKSETEGGSFWRIRQAAGYVRDGRFPPLTVSLGDDGRVYLKTA